MAEPTKKKPKYLVLGVRYKERKNDPPPGLHWHKVGGKKNSTLGEIADQFHIRPVDLMLYNWHTIDLLEVNWYLYNYVGARKNNGMTYNFSSTDSPGMLLVPNIPDSIQKGPPTSVDASRNGSATLDNKLKIYVVEWLASGEKVPVSGKWLYVFSGSGGAGVNFGYDDPPPLPIKINREIPVWDADKPGSAFTPDFPGVFNIKEKPDKLEYEILITSESELSTDFLTATSGLEDAGKSYYQSGNNWYFLSDPTILKNATTQNRDKRTTHAFRNFKNNNLVTIDLSQDRRYYFLLSPVQLGPKAIKYAMANPKGLTPLLKPGENTLDWDPSNPNGHIIDKYIGPTAKDIKSGIITLPVIDPYAWAEDIVTKVYADDIKQYVEWVSYNDKDSSKYNETVTTLEKDTGWNLEKYFVAQLLKSVRDNHSEPTSIDEELKDPDKWKKDLKDWEQKLIQRNAEISANAHRSLIQLIEWLDGPGHRIIETAILKDTTAESSQDAIDVAHGIVHWAVCTQYMMALEPGVVYLRDVLKRPGTVPNDVILKHFENLDKDSVTVPLSKTHRIAFGYGYQGVFMLMALQDFVSPPPPIPGTLNRQQYLEKLAEYHKKRREKITQIFNSSKVLPGKLQVPTLPSPPSKGGGWSVGSAVVNSMLDIGDKFTTYVIDPKITIATGKPGTIQNKILNQLRNFEQYMAGKGKLGEKITVGSNRTLKGVSLAISGYNLIQAITTARYDYQHSVSATEWANVASGATIAVQDTLAEIASISKNAALQRIFPQLTTVAEGKAWVAVRVTGIAGRVFAGVNVLAMLVSGVTTMISMGQSAAKSYSRGDYTAATFYGVGVIGGAVMVGGALVFGYALMTAGAATAWTGVGVVLFAVGAIVAGIAALIGWLASSDDYQVFARKCFLGNEADREPRFFGDPPDWTHATNSDYSWTIENQKRALLNLLGRFQVKTIPAKEFNRNQVYKNDLYIEVTPGLIMPGSTVEVALHYDNDGTQTSAVMQWDKFDKGDKQFASAKPVKFNKGTLFDADDTYAIYGYKGDELNKITIFAYRLTYDGEKGALVTTVTLRYPVGYSNIIRCRKHVMEHGLVYGVTIDDDKATSDIYV